MRYRPEAALAAFSLLLIGLTPEAAAQPGESCTVGREVVDDRGGPGTIVGGRGALCLVRYQEGRMQAWVPAATLRDSPANPAAPEPGAAQETPPPQATTILHPVIVNRAVYRADALGHVVLRRRCHTARERIIFHNIYYATSGYAAITASEISPLCGTGPV